MRWLDRVHYERGSFALKVSTESLELRSDRDDKRPVELFRRVPSAWSCPANGVVRGN
jgi:hypothetical protein